MQGNGFVKRRWHEPIAQYVRLSALDIINNTKSGEMAIAKLKPSVKSIGVNCVSIKKLFYQCHNENRRNQSSAYCLNNSLKN